MFVQTRCPGNTPSCRDAIHRVFLQYRDADDPDLIGVDGISQLCSDLGVEPDDIVVLVLRWGWRARGCP
jgi:hypothetical protein